MASPENEGVDRPVSIAEKGGGQSTSTDNQSEVTADYEFHTRGEDEANGEEEKEADHENLFSKDEFTSTSIGLRLTNTKGQQSDELYSAEAWAAGAKDPQAYYQAQALFVKKLLAQKAILNHRMARRTKSLIPLESNLATEAHLRSDRAPLEKQTKLNRSTQSPSKQSASMASTPLPRKLSPPITCTSLPSRQSTRQTPTSSTTNESTTRHLRSQDPLESFLSSLGNMKNGLSDKLGQPLRSEIAQYPAAAAHMQSRYDTQQAAQAPCQGLKRRRGTEEVETDGKERQFILR